MTALANRLMKQNSNSRLKIESFTALKRMPQGEPWDTIKTLYAGPTQQDRFLGTLLNGLASSKKSKFLISKKLFSEMLMADLDVTRKGVNIEEFNSFMKIQQDNKVIQCERKPTPFSATVSRNRKAGVYSIIDQEILNYLKGTALTPSLPTSPTTTQQTSPEYETEVEHESETSCENESDIKRDSINNNESIEMRSEPSGSEPELGDSELRDYLGRLNQVHPKPSFGRKTAVNNINNPILTENDSLNELINEENESFQNLKGDSLPPTKQEIIRNQSRYSLREFEIECKMFSPSSSFAQEYLFHLIKSDYNRSIDFNDVVHLIVKHEKRLKDQGLDELMENYRQTFVEGRKQSEAANV